MTHRDDGFWISTDPALLDRELIHGFLSQAYWSPGIPPDVVDRGIAHSLAFGVYGPAGEQVGFARAISDRATYAYLADVFVVPGHRGAGLGRWLVGQVLAHPELQGLRRWALATADAHGLYARFGFAPPARPASHLFIDTEPDSLWGGAPS